MATASISKQEVNTGILHGFAIPLAALHRFNLIDTNKQKLFFCMQPGSSETQPMKKTP